MAILLAGDIGGTKTLLRLVESETTLDKRIPDQTTLFEHRYPSQDYPDLDTIIINFLAQAKDKIGLFPPIEKACFGIAGPVVDNTCKLSNVSWPKIIGTQLQQTFNIPSVTLINDFAAIGYGIQGLVKEDIYILQDVPRNLNAPIAVIGAGTGLGEGFLIPLANGRYQVYSSEGSHANFPPRSALEFRLLTHIKALYNINRVSVERVVSGLGITAIYQFLRSQEGMHETPQMKKNYEIWEQELSKPDIEASVDLANEISKAAVDQNDALCEKTMRLFIEAYGAEAGNLALKLLPYGGVYVAGGIAPKNLPLFKKGNFMEAFRDTGRMRPLMEKIPVYVILNPKIGLNGASLYAALID